ncbi:MAG TPA: AAA family ATPase, partial [Kofleriaceae bacterium]|nr:AAA family ATPase [Kofleriaceae bacterium]
MTELVGRAGVLEQLGEALDQAMHGRGRLVVVAGEAGIGKSALADAIAERAEQAGAACSYGRAWEFADAPPYFPLRAALRSIAVDVDAEPDSPFALWDRVLDQLARAAGERPRVWIVEDAHVADGGTLDLLAFLARPLRSVAALVVVTRRDRDPRLNDAAEQRLGRMARDGVAIALAPLDAAGVARLAAQAAGRELSDAACAQLVELTGGNPLFVVECARNLVRDAALPATLRQVVQERIAQLPPETRDVLLAAAVLGRELVISTIASVADVPPATVIERLTHAIRGGVVVESAPGELAFSHVIVRDAIEDAAPPASDRGCGSS